MRRLTLIIGTVFLSVLCSCQSLAPSQRDVSDNKVKKYLDQSELSKFLVSSKIAVAGRSLVHVSHVCNLTINQEQYLVIDMRELIKGAVVPRGLNQIVVLNGAFQLVQQIEYVNARPLFCEGNKLYLYGSLIVDGQSNEGNVLMFDYYGFKVVVLEENLNDNLPL